MPVPPAVELLSRPGCHLCDGIRPVLTGAVAELGLTLRERDISQHPVLQAAFGLRIPVVRSGGRVLAEGRIDAVTLRRALQRLVDDDPVASR